MFNRRLEATELDAVKRYTSRVHSLTVCGPGAGVDIKSLIHDLCLESMTSSLFPHLQCLNFSVENTNLPLFHHVTCPSITSLGLILPYKESDASSYGKLISSLGSNCPNVNTLRVFTSPYQLRTLVEQIIHQMVQYWTYSLQVVDFAAYSFSFDSDTFVHLSHMPNLTSLSCTVNPPLANQDDSSDHWHVLVFSSLKSIHINGGFISIGKLFTRLQLPVIKTVHVVLTDAILSRDNISLPLAMGMQHICTHGFHLTACSERFTSLVQDMIWKAHHPVLTLEDVYHFTALNLTGISIQLYPLVHLNDSDLLALAPGCQQLRSLVINEEWGWGKRARITPDGLSQFLRQCPLLQEICLALNTQDYTSPPPIQSSSTRDSVPSLSVVNVVDSLITTKSIPAMAAFFAQFIRPGSHVSIKSWETGQMSFQSHGRGYWENHDVYRMRWQKVCTLANKMSNRQQSQQSVLGTLSELLCSGDRMRCQCIIC